MQTLHRAPVRAQAQCSSTIQSDRDTYLQMVNILMGNAVKLDNIPKQRVNEKDLKQH